MSATLTLTLRRLLLLAALLLAGAARAEQLARDGAFIVHYAALPSTSIPADVAQRFGLRRSARRAVLVLNAQRDDGAGQPTPVPASGIGQARNLIGHVQSLQLRPAREGDVHYLLAEFEALDQEILTLEVEVLPEGATRAIRLTFQQQFYDD